MRMLSKGLGGLGIALCLLGYSGAAFAQTTIWTQHVDNWRSGWNLTETTLNTTNVATSKFQVLNTVTVDATIDAQPLIEPAQQITCLPNQTLVSCKAGLSGTYQVAYVATENSSLYAIDAATGVILLKRNFVPAGGTGAIQSTPVIDTYRNTIIFVTLSVLNNTSTLTLHALNVADFSDNVPAVNLTSSITAPLSNGTTYAFDANLARSKSGLMWANGAIYVPIQAQGETQSAYYGLSRGWMLKFASSNLSLIKAYLIDSRSTSTDKYYISSIWMSRTAPAADDSSTNANVYFMTGNSDPSGNSYDPVYNLEESAVALTQNLDPASSFTPSNYAALDKVDLDFGSGGILKVPTNYLAPPGRRSLSPRAGARTGGCFCSTPQTWAAIPLAGRTRFSMLKPPAVLVLALLFPGQRWNRRVVSSGGTELISWKIVTTPTTAKLVEEASAPVATGNGSNYQQGFFTAISSDGPGPHVTGVIWAVTRPVANTNAVNLYAFNAVASGATLQQLGEWPAGVWNQHFDSVIVPVVANGKVFVASDGVLTIFGLKY